MELLRPETQGQCWNNTERWPKAGESFGEWLNPAEHDVHTLSKLLRPFRPDEMTAYPVGTLVNNVRADKPECVQPLEVGQQGA